MDAPGGQRFRVEELLRFLVEDRDNSMTALLPIGALKKDHEVVTADMTDKITSWIALRPQHAGHQPDHLVATPIAVLVVVGFEMVQIGVAGDEVAAAREQAFDVVGDRDVAGQEGQGIGMARGLDPRLRHRAHQLLARTQPLVAAALGDDETFRQVALVARGQHIGEFLDAGVQLDRQRRQAGEQRAGLVAVKLLEIGARVVGNELAPVDECNRLVVFHHRQCMQGIGLAQHLVDRVVRGGRRNRGRRDQQPRRREAAVAGPLELWKDGNVGACEHALRQRQQLLDRLRQRATQRPALPERDAQVTREPQLLSTLQSLGDQARAECLCNLQQRPQGLKLVAVAGQVLQKVFVDLDDVGFQLRPQAQAGTAVAEVVEGDGDAMAAQGRARREQGVEVAHLFMFGQLDDEHGRRDTLLRRDLQHVLDAALSQHSHQRVGAEVQKQPPRAPAAGPCSKSLFDALDLEFEAAPFVVRHREQGIRHRQARVDRAAYQRFVGMHTAVPKICNRLEVDLEKVVIDEVANASPGQRCIGGSASWGHGQAAIQTR